MQISLNKTNGSAILFQECLKYNFNYRIILNYIIWHVMEITLLWGFSSHMSQKKLTMELNKLVHIKYEKCVLFSRSPESQKCP